MKYILQDLIDIEHFQNLQDRLNAIYSFPSAIIDNDGNVLTATGWQDLCTQFHRKNKETEKLCIKSDQYIKDHIHEANPAISYRCPHGLEDNATPIIIEGIHYGNFFTGQFFLEKPDMEFFHTQAQKYGFDEDAYLKAVKNVPVWTQEQLDNYLFFIKGLIAVISESGLKTLKEIENRKQIEAREKRHKSILKTAMDGYWLTDTEGRLLEVNDSYCRMSGYSEDDLLLKHISDLDVTKNVQLVAQHIQKVISQGLDRFESKHRHKDGTVFHVEVSVQYRNEDGGQFLSFIRDITERKQTEKALRESEKKFRDLFENMAQGVFYQRADGVLTDYNNAALEMFGLTPDQIIGKTSLDPQWKVISEDGIDLPADKHPSMVTLQTGKPVRDAVVGVYNPRTKDVKWLLVNAIPQSNKAGGKPYQVFVTLQDITDRREMEERFLQAQKMEAIGLMAGGVAHDLNNILSGIVTYPDLLLGMLPEESHLRKPIEAIQQSGKRAAEVVGDLLTVARGSASKKEITNLNKLVVEYLDSPEGKLLLARHSEVDITTELAPGLLNLSCSTIHIKKCLMNLMINAVEAVRGAGTIVISTRNQHLENGVVPIQYMEKGEYVIVSIRDSGSGITKEDISHVFEPFFTKKTMGRSGTGLGLAIVWNTVHEHAGTVTVDSDNKGTIFELYFPVSRKKATELPKTIKLETIIGNNEYILVIDDELQQRDIACQILKSLEYRVDAVSSGEEAVQFVRDNSVDLLLLDMIMEPGMNGRKTYEKILHVNPAQKAIIVSGFSDDEEVKKAKSLGIKEFIKKPYTLVELGLGVRKELKRNSSSKGE